VWSTHADLSVTLEKGGSGNVKRMKMRSRLAPAAWLDDRAGQGLGWIESFLETKTLWHPVGV
jgi:hypothetical protein